MEPNEYQTMFQVENDHFWYQGMRKISMALLDTYLPKKKKLTILDAGCGTGLNMLIFNKYGHVFGFDISSTAIKLCQKRGLKNLKIGSLNNIPYRSEKFDLVLCFDVIGQKEVGSVGRALDELYRVLAPGGILLIRTAAINCLFSSHDKLVHTRHRYSVKELKILLNRAGYHLIKATYANTFLFPIVIIVRLLGKFFQNNTNHSNVRPLPPFINYLMKLPLYLESKILPYVSMPIGSSVTAVAQKKSIV